MANSRDSLVGQRFGNYRITSLLGEGAQASVYLARDEALGRAAAVKVFKQLSLDRVSLVREARFIANLSHPNIISVYAVDIAGSPPYMAMEYARTSILEVVTKKGPLHHGVALRFARHAAAALEHAHGRGVVHCDVKPANMLLGDDGRVKLADFGLASVGGSSSRSPVGTPQYMAPEVWLGKGISSPCDVYSLGCCLVFMLTNRPPFPAKSFDQLKHAHLADKIELPATVPAAMAQLVHVLTAKKPQDRLQDAGAVVNEIWRVTDKLKARKHQSTDSRRALKPAEVKPAARSTDMRGAVTPAGGSHAWKSTDSLPALSVTDSRALPPPSENLQAENPAERVDRNALITSITSLSEAATLLTRLALALPVAMLTGQRWQLFEWLLQHLEDVYQQELHLGQFTTLGSAPLSATLASLRRLSEHGENLEQSESSSVARHPVAKQFLPLFISRALSADELDELVTYGTRLQGSRCSLVLACPAQVAGEISLCFSQRNQSDLMGTVTIDDVKLHETHVFVEQHFSNQLNQLPWTPSARLLLAWYMSNHPDATRRFVHNALVVSQALAQRMVNSFCCQAAAAHDVFLQNVDEIAAEWRKAPGSWPDAGTRESVRAIRAELESSGPSPQLP